MAQIKIKQVRGASQGSILFLGTNSVISENFENLRWEQNSNKLFVDGSFQYIDGNQQPGYVLTTDGSGLATWSQSNATQSIYQVPIAGTQNGVNKNYVLSYSITSPINWFYINGQLMTPVLDYIISGTSLSLTSERPAPTNTDILSLFGSLATLTGGMQTLNGISDLIQTITSTDDGDVNLSVNSALGVHNFDVSLNSTLTGKTFSGDVIVTEGLTVGSNSNYSGDLLPTSDAIYNLGSPILQWDKLYVASQSLYVGGVTISSDNDAISINRLNLGTELNPIIISGSGSDVFLNGSNSITGVDLINGVNITTHSSRHLPNGSDPLSTGVPSNVGTSNQEGIQNAFARQDHVHALGTDVVSDSNILTHTSSKISIINKSQLNSSIVYIDQSNTFGEFSNVFRSSNLSLTNPSNTFNYTFVGSSVTGNRNITLPLLSTNDTFVFENHIQTLTNKTLTSPVVTNPTISNPYVTGVATFSRSYILDAPIDNNETYKLAVNSSHEVIKVPLNQRASLYMNNNTTNTLTATGSWIRIAGIGSLSNLTSSTFTYSSSFVTLVSATGDGGFENTITTGTQGFADNGWVVVNGAQTNRWFVGSTGASGSGFGAYISNNNGVSNAYTTTVSSVVHFYRDIVIPAWTNRLILTFSIRTTGETTFDYVRVYNSATTFIPVAGTVNSNQIAEYTNLTGYGTQTIVINPAISATDQTRRITFTWRNDGSGGAQPPASIDNISIVCDPLLELKYTGSQSTFQSTLSGSFQSTATINNVGVQLSKSGSTSSNPSETTYTVSGGGANEKTSFVVQNIFTMSSGDYISPLINNKSSNTSVLVSDLFLNVIQID
jgi:hypothetical protein